MGAGCSKQQAVAQPAPEVGYKPLMIKQQAEPEKPSQSSLADTILFKITGKILSRLEELLDSTDDGIDDLEELMHGKLMELVAAITAHDGTSQSERDADPHTLKDGHLKAAQGGTHQWQNWGKTLAVRPITHHRPQTSADVLKVVTSAAAQGRRVRCVGHGHTWTPLFFSEEDQAEVLFIADLTLHGAEKGERISLARAAVKGVGCEHTPARVRLSAGVTTGELAEWLEENADKVGHVGLGSDVILNTVRYGGVISIPCHGTGINQRAVPDIVQALTVVHQVEGQWTVAQYDRSHPHWNVLRSNFGMAGVIIDMTFEMDGDLDKPYVAVEHTFPPMHTMFEGGPAKLKELVTTHYASEIFWFPMNSVKVADIMDLTDDDIVDNWRPMEDKMWLNMFMDRVDADPSEVQHFNQHDHAAKRRELVQVKLGRALNGWAQRNGSLRGQAAAGVLPMMILPLEVRNGYLRNGNKSLMRAIHYGLNIDEMFCYDYEVCIPVASDFSNIYACWRAAIDVVERTIRTTRTNPNNLALEMRFTRGSDILMCPSYVGPGGDTNELYCWIEVLGSNETPMEGWLAFVKDVHDAWAAVPHPHGCMPKPHWAKITDLGEASRLLGKPVLDWMRPYLKKVYGSQLSGFKAALQDLDPTGTFLCGWVAGLYE